MKKTSLPVDGRRSKPPSFYYGFKARLHMKMIFHSHANKTHFHLKGFVRSLVLKA